MLSKIGIILGLLLAAGFIFAGAAQAKGIQESEPEFLYNAEGNAGRGAFQIQIATPTPQEINPSEQARPLASEAGRDIGLIIAAAGLVLIVVGGVVWGLKRKQPEKTGD